MATAQRRKRREPFLDANGKPLSGAYLKYYRAGTTTDLVTFSDAAGTVPNTTTSIPSRPDLGALIQLDASGFTTQAVYLGQTYDAKEVLLDSGLAVISTEDNIPKGLSDFVAPAFSRPIKPRTAISVSTELTTADAGEGFDVTTGSSTIVLTLPDATTVGSGAVIDFKKVGASGVMRFATTGGQFIDGATTYDVVLNLAAVELVSDGANWRIQSLYQPDGLLLPYGIAQATGVIAQNGSTPSDIYDLQIGPCLMTNSAGKPFYFGGGTLSATLAQNGQLGRLDTGTRANDAWYYGHVVSDGALISPTTGLVISTNPVAPSLAGYPYRYRAFAVRTDGTGNLYRTKQEGKEAQYTLATGSAPTIASGTNLGTSITNSFAPPTAVRHRGFLRATLSQNGAVLYVAPNAQHVPNAPVALGSAGQFQGPNAAGFDFLNESASGSPQLYYSSTLVNGLVGALGWTDSVNAS